MATDVTEETEEDLHEGPSRATYLQIAAILAVMTTVEVLLYVFRDSLGRAVTTPSLIILTIGKFILVGAWFMHLRFDHPALRRLFIAGLALAAVIFAVVASDFFLGSNGLDPQGF